MRTAMEYPEIVLLASKENILDGDPVIRSEESENRKKPLTLGVVSTVAYPLSVHRVISV